MMKLHYIHSHFYTASCLQINSIKLVEETEKVNKTSNIQNLGDIMIHLHAQPVWLQQNEASYRFTWNWEICLAWTMQQNLCFATKCCVAAQQKMTTDHYWLNEMY